jgi:branched-chain amino acid transport system substrate-binding protein
VSKIGPVSRAATRPGRPAVSWSFAASGALLLAVAVACQRSTRPVRIAVASLARNDAVAFMAADDINARGGIRGRPLLVVHDTIPVDAEPIDLEIRRAQYLVAQRPVAVVGHGGSRGSLAAAPIYNEARVLQLVPSGTSRLLARAGPWTLTLVPNDSVEGEFIARFVRDELRARTVAIFYVSDEYGVGLRDGVRAALGPAVQVVREQRYGLGSDLHTLMDATVRGGAPDVIVVAGREAATSTIVRRLVELGLPSRVVAGDGAVVLPDLPRDAGPGAEGRLFAATFWLPTSPDTASQRFARAVQQRLLREATATDALVYDAVGVLATALRKVGDDPTDVRNYVLSLGRSRPRYRGVTGEIGFGAGAGPPRLVMARVRGQSLVPAGQSR